MPGFISMEKDSLVQVGKKIKEIRKQKRMSLQEVAERSNVTAGLISKIENFRTIPSLPVLLNISRALAVDMTDLVSTVSSPPLPPFQIIRKKEVEESLSSTPGDIQFFNISKKSSIEAEIQSYFLILSPESGKESLNLGGQHTVFLLHGNISCQITEEILELRTGDFLVFEDGIEPVIWNPHDTQAKILCNRIETRKVVN